MRALAALVMLAACERGAPGDCAAVADNLASFELGNYAPPEQRAPVIEQQRKRCEDAHVTKAEQACLVKATSKWAAARCAPRLYPDIAPMSDSECTEVQTRVRQALDKQVGQDPTQRAQMDKMLGVLKEACEQDGWPESLRQCVIAAPPGDMAAVDKCSAQMPKELETKVTERAKRAMLK